MGGDLAEGFSETGAVPFTMRRAAKFLVPKEPERSDLFAAIQTGQTALSKIQVYRHRDVNNVVSGTIMEQDSA